MVKQLNWRIIVVEAGLDGKNEVYTYLFSTWSEALAKLATFDGYAVEYCITRI